MMSLLYKFLSFPPLPPLCVRACVCGVGGYTRACVNVCKALVSVGAGSKSGLTVFFFYHVTSVLKCRNVIPKEDTLGVSTKQRYNLWFFEHVYLCAQLPWQN